MLSVAETITRYSARYDFIRHSLVIISEPRYLIGDLQVRQLKCTMTQLPAEQGIQVRYEAIIGLYHVLLFHLDLHPRPHSRAGYRLQTPLDGIVIYAPKRGMTLLLKSRNDLSLRVLFGGGSAALPAHSHIRFRGKVCLDNIFSLANSLTVDGWCGW